jgi:NAD(P)-dependent dehydrogenase (short-subunit alcohol dehydrogenase family)
VKDFENKVAVVTGAASGIGRALASRFAAEGMKVVLADIEPEALAKAESEIKSQGVEVLAVRTDVSEAQDLAALAQKTLDAFGAVHVLCNNAGVIDMANRPVWETPRPVLDWMLGVNIWGVIHGLQAFMPIMLEQDTEGHVVNTSSIAGLMSSPDDAFYNMTKHAVVALSEATYLDLARKRAKVKVSVLCPGFVHSRFIDAERNRPARLEQDSPAVHASRQERIETMRRVLQEGMPPAEVAVHVLSAIRREQFYILPDPTWKPEIESRMENILRERNPGQEPSANA